jgi:hypothetical protein
MPDSSSQHDRNPLQPDPPGLSSDALMGAMFVIVTFMVAFIFFLTRHAFDDPTKVDGVRGLYAVWCVGMIAIPVLCTMATADALPYTQLLLRNGRSLKGEPWKKKAHRLMVCLLLLSACFVEICLRNKFWGKEDPYQEYVPRWAYDMVNFTLVIGIWMTLNLHFLSVFTPFGSGFDRDIKSRVEAMNRSLLLELLVVVSGIVEMYANLAILKAKNVSPPPPSPLLAVIVGGVALFTIALVQIIFRRYLHRMESHLIGNGFDSPNDQSPTKEVEFQKRLEKLLPPQFAAFVFKMNIPPELLSGGAPLTTQSIEVVTYLKQKNRLLEAEDVLRNMMQNDR